MRNVLHIITQVTQETVVQEANDLDMDVPGMDLSQAVNPPQAADQELWGSVHVRCHQRIWRTFNCEQSELNWTLWKVWTERVLKCRLQKTYNS